VDLDLTPAHKVLRDQAREVALRDIAPAAAEVDRQPRFPDEALASLAKLGMLGVTVPKPWGGLGLDTVACALLLEEVAGACASAAAVVAVQNLLVCEPLLRFGSEAQRRDWLPGLVSGAKLGCFALTEAEGDSSTAGLGTHARRVGNDFVLEGSKCFVTCAPRAELALVFAETAPDARNGLSGFLVPLATPGVSIGAPHATLGLRGALSASLTLDRVRLPAAALLGSEGGGQEVLRFALEAGRIGAAALAVGIARAAFAVATRYAIERRSNDAAISQHQAIQFKLADMSANIDAARLLAWRAASARDRGTAAPGGSAMAKLVSSEVASRVASDAVQVLGGNGCLADYAVERHFRDAKVTEIYQGTSEIHRLGIASALLKE
jgi:butyryl-CoA dehydrogenase